MRIHIAGWPVKVGRTGRQLCAWCGQLLFEETGREAWTGGDGGGPRPWETGALVAVHGNLSYVIKHEDGQRLPDECCAPSTPVPRVALVAV
jgi:hypothetical protein